MSVKDKPPPWRPGESYRQGDKVLWRGKTLVCLLSHYVTPAAKAPSPSTWMPDSDRAPDRVLRR